MSGLEVNKKKLEEIYQEWRGNKSCYDNGRPVFEASELLDFADYCLTHKANDAGTGKKQSNIPDVIKSVCYKECGDTQPSGGSDNICLNCGSSIKQTVL